MTEPLLLEARALSKAFRVRSAGSVWRRLTTIIEDISLRLDIGRTLGLVGESGSGKSTLASVLIGDLWPSGGEARLSGRRPTEIPRRQRARIVQPIVQDPRASLDPRWPIGKLLSEPLEIHGDDIDKRHAKIASALEAVDLPSDILSRFPHEVSGGQAQRLAIARALVLDPQLLVCDEPLSALDLITQTGMISLFQRLKTQRRLSMLFISHDLAAVRELSDQMAVMYLGRIVEIGPPDVIGGPLSHPYTRALVAAAPRFTTGLRRSGRAPILGEPPSHAAKPPGCAFHPRCPAAAPVCRRDAPPTVRIMGEHSVTCHFAQPQALAAE